MAIASLEIMNDVVVNFGHILTTEHIQLKDILLKELIGTRAIVRKRAITCLGKIYGPFSMASLSWKSTVQIQLWHGTQQRQGKHDR
jgi:hypothetical protein